MTRPFPRLSALAALTCLALSGTAAPTLAQTGKWVCTAEKLQSGSYRGGKTATIHLKPYPNGAAYPVKRESDTKVTGVTKDGTPFTCVLS